MSCLREEKAHVFVNIKNNNNAFINDLRVERELIKNQRSDVEKMNKNRY